MQVYPRTQGPADNVVPFYLFIWSAFRFTVPGNPDSMDTRGDIYALREVDKCFENFFFFFFCRLMYITIKIFSEEDILFSSEKRTLRLLLPFYFF